MKRRYVHAGFALLSSGFLALAGTQLLNLKKIESSNHAVGTVEVTDDKPSDVRAQLSWANKLSEAGEFERAERAFNELINDQRNNEIGKAAQFNLANGYLRESLNPDNSPEHRLPMVELAKQRLRDLLEIDPENWDARYNLERALRLALKKDAFEANDKGKPIKRVNIIVPDFKIKDLP